MQDFPPAARPCPEPPSSERPPGPRTRARQAAETALTALDTAIGLGDGAVRVTRSVAGPVMVPFTSAVRAAASHADRAAQAWPRPWLRQAAARGRRDRDTLTSAAARLVLSRVPGLATALLDQLDLTAEVAGRVDVNAVAEKIDVDAIARRLDVIAILERLDPDAVTRYLLEELDLPDIIQSSTGSIVSDTVHDVRMLSITADERLGRAVDAILLRRRAPRGATREAAGPGT